MHKCSGKGFALLVYRQDINIMDRNGFWSHIPHYGDYHPQLYDFFVNCYIVLPYLKFDSAPDNTLQ